MIKKVIFKNTIFNKKDLNNIIAETFINYGAIRSCLLADKIKQTGFSYATKSGISITIEDLKVLSIKKKLLLMGNEEIKTFNLFLLNGKINFVERFYKIIQIWTHTSEVLKINLLNLFSRIDPLNPIYLMIFSGARGNLEQVHQLIGMRGLMADPSGKIIDTPILSNFREGLSVIDYIMSAYGARKGVVDTSIKTANAGYLTRRLIDVAQEIIIRNNNCLTKRFLKIYKKKNYNLVFAEKIIGRTCAETIYCNILNKIIIKDGELITKETINYILLNSIKSIKIYSALTCESIQSICKKCYGWDLSKCELVSLGEAIGIIAAQSIGEPGTQLTMRTFHTGGVFTSTTNSQILSKINGLFYFNNDNLKTIQGRTLYGTNIKILEYESNFTIINYNNIKTIITLPIKSILYCNNKSIIKKDDLIAELTEKEKQAIKSKKFIFAPHSGEIFFSIKNKIIWILHGDVYDIYFNSYINNFNIIKKISIHDNLFYFKITAKNEGILKVSKNRLTNQIETITISKYVELLKYYTIFLNKKSKKIILIINFLKIEEFLTIKILLNKKNNLLFAQKYSSEYENHLRGNFTLPINSFFSCNNNNNNNIIFKNGKLLFIPSKKQSITKNSKFKSYESSNFFKFTNINKKQCLSLKYLNKKIYFFGETILKDIYIPYLTFVKYKQTNDFYLIILYPIYEFNISKSQSNNYNKKECNFIFKNTCILQFDVTNEKEFYFPFSFIKSQLLIKNKKKVIKKPLNFIYKVLNLNSFIIVPNYLKKQKLTYLKNIKSNYIIKKNILFDCNNNLILCNLIMINEEIINNFCIAVKNFKNNNNNLKLVLLINNFEYVEKNTIISKIFIKMNNLICFKNIKNQLKIKKKLRILINNSNNYKSHFTDKTSFFIKKNNFNLVGDKIQDLKKINYSGKIIKKTPFKIILHKGTPFFITYSTRLYIKNKKFIRQKEFFGSIDFEQMITGDIIQGLPKIEAVFEIKKYKNEAFLNTNFGIIENVIDNLSIIEIFTQYNQKINVTFNIDKSVIIKKRQFVYVGQPLTEGSINFNKLLITYFSYYNNFSNNIKSAFFSFQNIQILLIEKVQKVYISQGVLIADKHIEIIVKMITSKIKITEIGDSFLLYNEILDLIQINYINNILIEANKNPINFYPILLGITKISLLSNSFLAAASFQQTTKILISAAIYGKIDWLRGFKENVIIGNVMLAGNNFS